MPAPLAALPRVLVTRPQQQAQAMVADLREAGIDALALPLIEIRPVADARPLQQAWASIGELSLLMFVSANAVQAFMAQRPAGYAWPARMLAGSTGPGTSAALREAGVPAAALVEPAGADFDSEALWLQLRARDWAGRRVLVVRGEQGRDWLAEQLDRAGATVAFLAAYERHVPCWRAEERALLGQALGSPARWLWLFSSSEAVANLGRLAPGADWSQAAAMASHPRIEAAARRLGFGRVSLGPLSPAAVHQQLRPGATRSIQSDTS